MKICHLGSYDKNIGDNVALYNIREWFEGKIDIDWQNCDLNEFYAINNEIKKTIEKIKILNDNCDGFFIGGGGLIEGGIWNNTGTGWKLPFNEEILKYITKPIFCIGLGVNYFRGLPRLTERGWNNLQSLIEKSSVFSVRNDGSFEILANKGFNGIYEVPDPGLIYSTSKSRNESPLDGFFQPAMNLTPAINIHRKLTRDNMTFLENLSLKHNLISLPHTSKDFKFFYKLESFYEKEELAKALLNPKMKEILKCYTLKDYGVVMRGHGQLISCGMNVPAIYFSTQDKVLGFSMKNGYKNYTVDTHQQNWKDKLESKIFKLKNDEDYLNKWYDINEANIDRFHNEFDNYLHKILIILKEQK